MADNFHFDMTGVPLGQAIAIAFQEHSKAIGWCVVGNSRLILFWSEDHEATKFPAPMNHKQVIPFIQAWLESADYGMEPDHDGSNVKGCRVFNEAWGHVGHKWQAFVAIEPAWLWYGK